MNTFVNAFDFFLSVVEQKTDLGWLLFLLENRVGCDHILFVQKLIDHGVTPKEIIDSLTALGKITEYNKEDVMIKLYTSFLKGRNKYKRELLISNII